MKHLFIIFLFACVHCSGQYTSSINVLDYGVKAGSGNASIGIIKAVEAAGDGQVTVIPFGYFACLNSIDLRELSKKKSIHIECYGHLEFKGTDGLLIGGNQSPYYKQTVNIWGSIDGPGNNDNTLSYTNTAVTIENVQHAEVNIHYIAGWKTAISLQATGSGFAGVSNCKIRFDRMINNSVGLRFLSSGNIYNYVNQNYIEGGTISADTGIVFNHATYARSYFNRNNFVNVSFEGIKKVGAYLDKVQDCHFSLGRSGGPPENPDDAIMFWFTSNCMDNIVEQPVYDYTIKDKGTSNVFTGVVWNKQEKRISKPGVGMSLKK